MPGGIIGMNNNRSARAGCDRLLQSMKVDLPVVVIDQRVAHQFYILNVGQKLEQRIAGGWDQQLVTGIAEHPKNKGICLAGAGGEQYVLDGNLVAAGGVICGNCLASCFEALWIRLIAEGVCIGEGSHDGWPVIVESALCRVGGGKVKQRPSNRAMPGKSFAQAVSVEVPVRAIRKPYKVSSRISRGRMARPEGFEPPTLCLEGRRSIP